MKRRAPPSDLALLALAVALACGGGSRALRAADEAQAVEGVANAAQAEVSGVAVLARVGGWRGDPRDLEQRLTPVDVTVRNGAGRTIRLGPEAFWLVVGGARLRVLDQAAVSRALSDLAGFRTRPRPPRVGAVGGPTFPGYDGPDPFGPRSRAPRNAPVPALESWHATQPVSATLETGSTTAVLLFFDTPARSLRSAALEVDLVATDGSRIGTIRLPFERG